MTNAFFKLSRTLKVMKDKDVDIIITDEETFDKNKIYENTNEFIKKINNNTIDIN